MLYVDWLNLNYIAVQRHSIKWPAVFCIIISYTPVRLGCVLYIQLWDVTYVLSRLCYLAEVWNIMTSCHGNSVYITGPLWGESTAFWPKQNIGFFIPMSQNFVAIDPIYNESALVKKMAWHRTGDKPLPDLIMTLFTNVCMRHRS